MLPTILILTFASSVHSTPSPTWTDHDSTVFQTCDVSEGCPSPDEVCVSWTSEDPGLCAGPRVPKCRLTSDCPHHSHSCEVTLVEEGSGRLVARGFCMPALFYVKNPRGCSQPMMRPLPCETPFGRDRGVVKMGLQANRFCHTYEGLQGRCLPYHCQHHVDCGFALVDNQAFLGSCEQDRKCIFDASGPLTEEKDVDGFILNIMEHIKRAQKEEEEAASKATHAVVPSQEL